MSRSVSDDDSDSKDKTVQRNPTSSEIFFTPEERLTRKQYRMNKSEFCLKESEKLYDKLTGAIRVQELKDEESKDEESKDEVTDTEGLFGTVYPPVEDPTDERREVFLKKKYQYLQDGISVVIKAADRPYLFTHKSRDLDSPGRRHAVPKAIRTTRSEVFVTTAPPFERTCAYTKKWLNVCNLNFEVIKTLVTTSTQTESKEVLSKPIMYKGKRTQDEDEQVDLYDIPLDADGNPIGKRTGFCEWCGDPILPIPTDYVLSKIWDRKGLYCCEKYRQLLEEILRFEKQLRNKINDDMYLIDVTPKMKPSREPVAEVSEEEAKLTKVVKRPVVLRRVQEALAKIRASRDVKQTLGKCDQTTDTTDLPWDPYESRYNVAKPFNDQLFDDALDHVYRNVEIVFQQTETFSIGSEKIGLGDLLSATADNEAVPE